jgi:hypothetical protein
VASNTEIEYLGINEQDMEVWKYFTVVFVTCECRDSFENAGGPVRGANAPVPGEPIAFEVVPCEPGT